MTDRRTELRELLFAHPAMARELPPRFDPATAPDGPGALFADWLIEALRGGEPDAQAAVLGTTGPDGAPDARVVALRDLEPAAALWWFHGDAGSPKGRQLAADPRAALTFYWPGRGRQVRVRGPVAEAPASRTAAAFRELSPKSRVAALVGRQSERLAGPGAFAEAWQAAQERLAGQPELVAPGYRQYALRAAEVEFWQGSADRQHLRLVYRRDGAHWRREVLWP